MADITIPDLDDAIIAKLKQHAWQSGVPLDEVLRRVLAEAAWSRMPEGYTAPMAAFDANPHEDGRALN
jgi:hypothetical protein